ncbi:MAG: hypothetical protein Q8R60_05485 [Mycobacteriales bacterium]|nr:hypothetical protein [Mycobacteriales bacterium]
MADDVSLTDLEVIQQFSLAVRGASAPREAVIRALESDLAFLTGSGRRTAKPAATKAPAKTPAKAPAKSPAAKAPARGARRA